MALPEMKEISRLYEGRLVLVSLSIDDKTNWEIASRHHDICWWKLDFGHVLVLESFVNTHVVVAPAEVARGTRFHSGTRTSGDGIHHDVIIQH